MKIKLGVYISLEKCFFMGGGIGGGLFNVVIILVVLNVFWGLRLFVY